MTGSGVHTQGEPVWVRTRDGRALYAMVLPGPAGATGVPTVVFEAGSAATRSTWASVQTRVAAFTRAVVYDRAGWAGPPWTRQGAPWTGWPTT